jgi:aldose 1-epimerase
MIRLESEGLVCAIEPQLGGCIAGLWLDRVPVLRATHERPASARQSGSYPLVPFSNRIERATLQWQGTAHPLINNNAPEPHAIHGVGWERPWEVLDSDDSFAMLAYEHPADASWPFAFDSSQVLRLRGTTLELTLSLTNQSHEPAPVGLGWHPYFVKRAGSRIAFEATGRWEMGPDKLPTIRSASKGIDGDCGRLDVDHCFDGWSGVATLHDDLLTTTIRSNLRRVVVFTTPSRDTIAIEPVSHVNNAINLVAAGADADTLGLHTLQPGETLTAQMSIEVERVK